MRGAIQLHEIISAAGATPAWVHFGSIVGVYAGAGLGCYAAANDFLEWFAAFQRRECALDARVLAWTAWQDLGISARG